MVQPQTKFVGAVIADAGHHSPTVELEFVITGNDDQRLIGKTITLEVDAASIEYPEGTEWVEGSGLKMTKEG